MAQMSVEPRRTTYMSCPYVWRPSVARQPSATRKAASSSGTGETQMLSLRARSVPSLSASQPRAKGLSGQGAATAGTPPSMNARPPYFEGRTHAQRVGELGLHGKTVCAGHHSAPSSSGGGVRKERPSTAERLRNAQNRRAANSTGANSTPPACFSPWEYADPDLTNFQARFHTVANISRPSFITVGTPGPNVRRAVHALRPSSSHAIRGASQVARSNVHNDDAGELYIPPRRPATAMYHDRTGNTARRSHFATSSRPESAPPLSGPAVSDRFSKSKEFDKWRQSKEFDARRVPSQADSSVLRGWSPATPSPVHNSFLSASVTTARPRSDDILQMDKLLHVTSPFRGRTNSAGKRGKIVKGGTLRELRVPIEVLDEDDEQSEHTAPASSPIDPEASTSKEVKEGHESGGGATREEVSAAQVPGAGGVEESPFGRANEKTGPADADHAAPHKDSSPATPRSIKGGEQACVQHFQTELAASGESCAPTSGHSRWAPNVESSCDIDGRPLLIELVESPCDTPCETPLQSVSPIAVRVDVKPQAQAPR